MDCIIRWQCIHWHLKTNNFAYNINKCLLSCIVEWSVFFVERCCPYSIEVLNPLGKESSCSSCGGVSFNSE